MIKHDGHLRTRGKCRKHSPGLVFSTFLECSQMTGVFYHSVRHGLGFFICFNSGAPAAEGRQAEPHTHISGAPAAEGRQAEPHTHIRKLKGTHELIFSCVSWLAVLLVGAYARRRRRRRRRWWSRATWRPQLTRKPKRGFSFRGLSL